MDNNISWNSLDADWEREVKANAAFFRQLDNVRQEHDDFDNGGDYECQDMDDDIIDKVEDENNGLQDYLMTTESKMSGDKIHADADHTGRTV